jgi:NitT/TauT family transport system substrate-binding protein
MKRLASAAIVTAALLATPALAQPQKVAPEKSKVTLAVGGRTAMVYLALTIAWHKGFFRDEGIDFSFFDVQGGTRALQAMIGGSVDIGTGVYQHMLSLQAKKQYGACFALLTHNIGVALMVPREKAAQIKSYRDLKGLKIGVTSPGSGSHQFVTHLMASVGMTQDDFAAIGVGTAGVAVAAMKSGRIDALSMNEPSITLLGDSVSIIAESITNKGAEKNFGGPVPSLCVYAPEKFIKENPKTVQALANAITRANHLIATASLDEIAASVPPEDLQGDRDLFLRAFQNTREMYSPDGVIMPGSPERALKMVEGFDEEVRNTKIDLPRTYDNTFVERANKRLQN